jgi:hypothetical protein
MLTTVTLCRGCVSGAQISNIRDKIMMGDDEYRWDAIDGYDELELVSSTCNDDALLTLCSATTLRSRRRSVVSFARAISIPRNSTA